MHLSDILKANMCKFSHHQYHLPTEFYFKFAKDKQSTSTPANSLLLARWPVLSSAAVSCSNLTEAEAAASRL